MTTAMEETLIDAIRDSWVTIGSCQVYDPDDMRRTLTKIKNILGGMIVYYDSEKSRE